MSSFAMPAGGLPRRLALTRSSGSGSQGRYQGRYAGFAPPAEGAGVADGERGGSAGGAGTPAAAEPAPAPVSAAVDAAAEAPVPDVAWTPPSWEEIVREHSARIYRLAYRLTGNQHDAEDLTQEVFVRVFRSLSSYTPGTFEGWMHRITTNLFLDQARRKQRIRFDALPDDSGDRLAGREPGPELAWEHNNLDYDVQAALDTLPPDFRAAVVLCDIEGLSYEESERNTRTKTSWVRSSASCWLPVSR